MASIILFCEPAKREEPSTIQESMIIPTRYRDKLPRAWSYPVGAELLSEILDGVPQLSLLTIGFHPRQYIFRSAFERAIRAGQLVTVLEISYRNQRPGLTGSNDMIAEGWYSEHWEISVFAVPSTERAAVRAGIVGAGNRVRFWLTQSRTQTWREAAHTCRLRVRFGEPEVYFEET